MSARRRRVFSEAIRSLDELLARTPEQLGDVGIAETNLLCATGLRGAESLNLPKCLATLRTWARRVERETNCHRYLFSRAPDEYENSEGFFRMMMLVTVLQQDFKVRYNPDRIHGIDFRNSRDLFIHGLLEEPHAGTCASMPVLYVGVGRRLGYPLKLVLTHGHIFARWESPDGRERFNIECASRGMLSFPDEYYKAWPIPITDEQARRQRYLISLGPAEELAVFLDSRGHCLLDTGKISEARVAYEHACRLDPLRPAHRCWLNEVDAKKSASVGQFVQAAPYPYWETTVALLDPSTLDNACSADCRTFFSLNSTRYRYYHPGLGRWIERDPVEKKPVNLYEYVAGNPAGFVDPEGLAEVSVTLMPGYYEREIPGSPGQARVAWKFSADCRCDEQQGWVLENLDVQVTIAVTLDPVRSGHAPMTKKGVFGHEQRHALKVQEKLESAKAEIMTIFESAEGATFPGRQACDNRRRAVRDEVGKRIVGAVKAGAQHADSAAKPPRKESEGWPVAGKQYPPMGPEPNSAGAKLPWEAEENWRLRWQEINIQGKGLFGAGGLGRP